MGNMNPQQQQQQQQPMGIRLFVKTQNTSFYPNEFVQGSFCFSIPPPPPPKPVNPNPQNNQKPPNPQSPYQQYPYMQQQQQQQPQQPLPPPPPVNPIAALRSTLVHISIIQEESAQGRRGPPNTLLCLPIEFPQLKQLVSNPDLIFPFEVKIPLNARPSFEYPCSDANCSIRTYIQIEVRELRIMGSSFIVVKAQKLMRSSESLLLS